MTVLVTTTRVAGLICIGLASSCAGPAHLGRVQAPSGHLVSEASAPQGQRVAEVTLSPSDQNASQHQVGMTPIETNTQDFVQTNHASYEVTSEDRPEFILNSYRQPATEQTFTTPIEAMPAQPRQRAVVYPASASALERMSCPHGCPAGQACPSCPSGPAYPQGAVCDGSMGATMGGPGCPPCAATSQTFTDEYLCDGGNRDPGFYAPPAHSSGLETEDTLVEYATHEGVHKIKYSNPVCVYAPRFSEVRSTSGLVQNVNIDRPLGAHELAFGAHMNNRVEPVAQEHQTKPVGNVTRNRASGYEDRVGEGYVGQIVSSDKHVGILGANEDYSQLTPAQDVGTTRALFLNTIQAAAVWTRDLYPQISASVSGGNEMTAEFKAAGLDGVEEKITPGELVIIKQADRSEAHVGEVITFTIQFRNTGSEPVYNVVIADNLTPRLSYVEGSQTSDVDVEFVREDNGEGSSVLSWKLNSPLEGNATGKLTFQTLVK